MAITNVNPLAVRKITDPAVASRIRNKKAWPVDVVSAPASGNGLLGVGPIQVIETADIGEVDEHMENVQVYDYGSDTYPAGHIPNAEPIKVYVVSGSLGGGGPGYSAESILFDGSNDYLVRGAGLTGASDTTGGVFCCRIKFNGGDGVLQRILFSQFGNVKFSKVDSPSDQIEVTVENSSGTVITRIYGIGAPLTADGNWHTILAAWDNSAAGVSAGRAYMYIDDVDVSNVTIHIAGTCDYTQNNWSIGSEIGGAQKLDACIENLGLHTAYMDITNASIRAQFYNGSGEMEDPGSDGSNYFGSQPLVMMQNPVATWQENTGSGGNFTENGALTACP